jgi:nucleotide-binding universal stress UspA family protein
MRKILVPTDLTPIAELGLKLAVQIAKKAGATVSLVNFTKHPFNKTFTAMGDANTKQIEEDADLFTIQLLHVNKQKLESLVARYNKDVAIEFSIEDDDFKKGIDVYLERENIDLIVMGTSGEENATELFTGNHTEQVIQISKCPVISVRDGFNINEFNNIVLAVNTIDEDKIVSGLRSLHTIAGFFDARIHMVHVLNNATESVQKFTEYFTGLAEATGLKKYSVTVLEAHHQAEGVMMFARQVRAGLVAVIKKSHDKLFHIFSHHFSDRMVKEMGRPVLTVNAEPNK